MAAFKRIDDHVQAGLDKIRNKTWAEPLGKVLATGATIANTMEGFIPGFSFVGGALSLGATILNPEPGPLELQQELQEVKQMLNDNTQPKIVLKALQTQKLELESLLENSIDELQSDFVEIKTEMRAVLKSIERHKCSSSEEMLAMKNLIEQTFLLVADVKYRVCNL